MSCITCVTKNIPHLYSQAIIFHLESHPTIPGFTQCVTKGFFSKDYKWLENTYNTGTLCLFYFLPLLFIIVCYAMIIKNIDSSNKSSNTTGSKSIGNSHQHSNSGNPIVRSSKHRFRIRTPTFSNTDNTISGSIASGSMRLNHDNVDLKTISPSKANQIKSFEAENVAPKNKETDVKLMKNQSGIHIPLSLSPSLIAIAFCV